MFKNILKFDQSSFIYILGTLFCLLFFYENIILFLNENIDFTRIFVFESYQADDSSSQRIIFFKKAIESICKYPLLGLGIGSSGLILENIDNDTTPHNLFLEAFMETGILGVCCYFLLWLFFFANITVVRKNRKLLLLYLIAFFFFFQDNKSNSFDSWRITIVWIMLFLIEKKNSYRNRCFKG